jgi:hypothetical protein
VSAQFRPLKYLKSDLELHDEVKHSSQCGSKIQRAGQQDCGNMEEQQTSWVFPKGMPSYHRLLQQREDRLNIQLIDYIINQSIIHSINHVIDEGRGATN